MSNTTEDLITIALTGQQARLVAAALSLWGAELDHRAETARTTEQDRWETAQLAAWDAGTTTPEDLAADPLRAHTRYTTGAR